MRCSTRTSTVPCTLYRCVYPTTLSKDTQLPPLKKARVYSCPLAPFPRTDPYSTPPGAWMQAALAPPKTLAEVGAAVGASEADMLQYPEADMRELLKDELHMGVVARNAVMVEWRALKAKSVVITVQARFVAFLERMGGSAALQGLEHVPVSTLPEAVSFIQGHGAPSQAELQLGIQVRARAQQQQGSGYTVL
jgi:hypothetical protein